MAHSNLSEDFSNLSLIEPGMDMLSLEDRVNSNPSYDGSDSEEEQQSNISDYDDYLNEKYISEENEKDHMQEKQSKQELREYQKELAINALNGHNTIICAATGSGKTRVAAYIIQEHFKRSNGMYRKVAFLARNVSLADQQYKSLCKYLPSLKIELITGDSINSMSLHLSIPENDIIVMTPMILENHLKAKLVIHLGIFSMLVFDECHHTRKGEPYNTLMHSYHRSKIQNDQAGRRGEKIILPKIVGLTASIGIEGAEVLEVAVNNIMKVCANLDALKMSTIEEDQKELVQFVPVPKEETRPLLERKDDESVFKIISVMMKLEKHMEKYIQELSWPKLDEALITRPPNRKSQEYEQWSINMMKVAKAVPIFDSDSARDKRIRLIIITANYLKEYRFALETYDLVELEDVMEYLETSFQYLKRHEERLTEENTFYMYFVELEKIVKSRGYEANPNLRILAQTVVEYLLEKTSKSRAIVFVRTRALAQALAAWLNRSDNQEIRNLKACVFTGANMPEQKGGTPQTKQDSILLRFREGDVRLIVATSVAEEGLDIPNCNLVIKYNHVGNEVSTVQTRGRSRAFDGISILLAMNNVLQRERVNQRRAELMKKAIASIKKMTEFQFEAAIERHQKEIFETVLFADDAEQYKRKQVQLVEIVCSLCRKVLVENTNVKTIYGKHRISIDRNLPMKIKIYPKPERVVDEIPFVGLVKCMSEIGPEKKKCLNLLGQMIKYKDVHFIAIGIKNVVFNTGNDAELRQFKQWSKVPFAIDEITDDDIIRFLKSQKIEKHAANDETEDDSVDFETNYNRMQRHRISRDDTELKRPY